MSLPTSNSPYFHITFHQLDELVEAARTYSRQQANLLCWTPVNAAITYGIGWFVEITRLASRQVGYQIAAVLDCGDRADIAHQALRLGLKHVCFHGSAAMAVKLQQIAVELQAELHITRPLPETSLDLTIPNQQKQDQPFPHPSNPSFLRK